MKTGASLPLSKNDGETTLDLLPTRVRFPAWIGDSANLHGSVVGKKPSLLMMRVFWEYAVYVFVIVRLQESHSVRKGRRLLLGRFTYHRC